MDLCRYYLCVGGRAAERQNGGRCVAFQGSLWWVAVAWLPCCGSSAGSVRGGTSGNAATGRGREIQGRMVCMVSTVIHADCALLRAV